MGVVMVQVLVTVHVMVTLDVMVSIRFTWWLNSGTLYDLILVKRSECRNV